MTNEIRTAIFAAGRSPFHPQDGLLSKFHITKTAGQVIKKTTKDAGLLTDNFNKEVRQAILGCSTQVGTQAINPGVRVLWEAFGTNSRPIFCRTEDASCGSSLDAIILAHLMIKSGEVDYVITGGFDANVNGQAPAGSNAQYQTTNPKEYITNFISTVMLLLKFRRNPTRLGEELFKKTLAPDHNFTQMNESGDYIARIYEISSERATRYAAESFAKTIDAKSKGYFKKETIPINMGAFGYVDDDQIRETSTLFAQRNLRPTLPDGIHNAASSSQFGVGASCVIVGNLEKGLKAGRIPLAEIIDYSETGVGGGPGQLLAPINAIDEIFEKTGFNMEDMDLVEVNEAYAALPLIIGQEFGIPEKNNKLNVHGGALALTHPFAASGGRLVAHTVHELERIAKEIEEKHLDKKIPELGLITACVAQGLGPALMVKRYTPD